MQKLNKYKYLISFVVLLLLFISFNLQVFALPKMYNLADYNFVAQKTLVNGDISNVTSYVSRVHSFSNSDINRGVTSYSFRDGQSATSALVTTGLDLDIYTNNKYTFDFYAKLVLDSSDPITVNASLMFSIDGKLQDGIQLFTYGPNASSNWVHCSSQVVIPDYSGVVQSVLLLQVKRTSSTPFTSCIIYISDISVELNNPLNDGYEINAPSQDDLIKGVEDLEEIEGSFPTITPDDLDSIFQNDLTEYSSAMGAIRECFEKLMAFSGLNSIFVFGMSIGLAAYFLGRRLK